MFPHSRAYMSPPSINASPETAAPSWFTSTTNPAAFELDGHRFLATAGQPLDDIYKYLPSSFTRLQMMEAMLRWRLVAPTAPDTLPCYPFQDGDAFVLKECPHVFICGNQPQFEEGWVEGSRGERVRVLGVPNYRDSGEVVLIDLESLEVEVVKIGIFGEG